MDGALGSTSSRRHRAEFRGSRRPTAFRAHAGRCTAGRDSPGAREGDRPPVRRDRREYRTARGQPPRAWLLSTASGRWGRRPHTLRVRGGGVLCTAVRRGGGPRRRRRRRTPRRLLAAPEASASRTPRNAQTRKSRTSPNAAAKASPTSVGLPSSSPRPASSSRVMGFTTATPCNQPRSSDSGTYTGAKNR